MKRSLLLTVAAGLLLTGCASSRSVLYSGVTVGLSGKRTIITDAVAVRDAGSVHAEWVATIRRENGHGLGVRFSGVPSREFRSRLAAAASRYGFVVKRVEFLHQPLPTPLVVVQTSRYVAFARAVPAIDHSVDPHEGRDDLTGWSFRAFYLEALDERGVPFLVVHDVIGADGVAGGQWARSDPLFPFIHG
ncbi:MAG: hypothetical protein ACRDLM_12030 [Gaiellaceae bacterium]